MTTQIIRREWAIMHLQQLLKRNYVRLVLLVGSGGSSKTYLALHIVGQLIDQFAQGVWFVPLAGVNDPTLVPMSILQAFNIQSNSIPLQKAGLGLISKKPGS